MNKAIMNNQIKKSIYTGKEYEITQDEYYHVYKRYLADALSWLGYEYLKFINDKGEAVWSFKNTEKFQIARLELIEFKKKYGSFKNAPNK